MSLLAFYVIPSHKQFSPGAVVGVLHVGDADGGIADPVVHHRVHRDRHTVLGQHLFYVMLKFDYAN